MMKRMKEKSVEVLRQIWTRQKIVGTKATAEYNSEGKKVHVHPMFAIQRRSKKEKTPKSTMPKIIKKSWGGKEGLGGDDPISLVLHTSTSVSFANTKERNNTQLGLLRPIVKEKTADNNSNSAANPVTEKGSEEEKKGGGGIIPGDKKLPSTTVRYKGTLRADKRPTKQVPPSTATPSSTTT